MPLGADIICPITGGGVLADFVLIWHSQCGPRETTRRRGRKRRRMIAEPGDMGLTGVGSATQRVAVVILLNKRRGKITEPLVVRRRLANPARTGMILMGGLIAMDTGLRRRRGIYVRGWGISVKDILCRPEKLRGFEEHLDHVFVAVPLGCDLGIQVEKEDVHLDEWLVLPQCPIKFSRPSEGMRRGTARLVPGAPPQATAAPSRMTNTIENKRVLTHDLYVRNESGLCPGDNTIPRFGPDGKIQFSPVSVDAGGSMVVPGNLTVMGTVNGGGGGGGGGGVSVAAGPSGNISVNTAGGVATVDLVNLLSGVNISGDIDVDGELETESLRVLTSAIIDGPLSADSANITGNTYVGGSFTGGSTITSTGKIRSTGGDVEAINGIFSNGLDVNGEITAGSIHVDQGATVDGLLEVEALDVSKNAAIAGNLTVAGTVTAGGLSLTNAFQVNQLHVMTSATISGDLYVNQTIHHVGLFDPPIGGPITLLDGSGISITVGPAANTWTITATGGGGGGGGISGINEGTNIQVSGSGTNPTIGIEMREALDMCNNKIINVDIIELVSTANDQEDPRISFKNVAQVEKARIEYDQDNQTAPLLLAQGPLVRVEAKEATTVAGVSLVAGTNALTVTTDSVDLSGSMLTLGGIKLKTSGEDFVIENTNSNGGYQIKNIPEVGTETGFDNMLVYKVGSSEIRQIPAPAGTDISAGTNISVNKTDPAEPVISLEIREDVNMGNKRVTNTSGITFFNGGSLTEGGSGSLRIGDKLGINTTIGSTPSEQLEVNGGIKSSTLFLTGPPTAASAHPSVLGYNSGTGEIELQPAAGGGAGSSVTAGTNIDVTGDVVSLAIDSTVDMCGQDLTNAATLNATSLDICGSAIIGDRTGTTGVLRLTHQFGETFIESAAGRTTGSSAPLHFTDYNAQRSWLTISSVGNIGIGTQSPISKLHINGETCIATRPLAIFLGASGSTIRYSYDGISWSDCSGTLFTTRGFDAVANNIMWIAVGQGGNTILKSNDGIVWSTTSGSFTTAGRGVAWNNTQARWVTVGDDGGGANTIKYSADGVTWTTASNTFTTGKGFGVGVSSAGDKWVATGAGDTTLKYSSDGQTWVNATNPFTTEAYKVAHNGSLWVAVGLGGGTIKWSDNGETWNNSSSGEFMSAGEAIAYGGSLWVAGGLKTVFETTALKYSVDGKNWINADSGGVASVINDITYTSDVDGTPMWIATCLPLSPSTSRIKYSYDGKNWSDLPAINLPGATGAYGVTWGPVIVSDANIKSTMTSVGKDCTVIGAGTGANPAFYWRSNATYYKANFGGTSYFTGQHANVLVGSNITKENMHEYVGLIVSSADNGYCSIDSMGRMITGSDAIWTTEALPRVKLTDRDSDKAVWGVITNHRNGMRNSDGSPDVDNNTEWETSLHGRIRVNGVGEGAIWVVDANGPLENGDYICSSEVPGYGRKQSDDLLHNYTVAKITMSCAFELGQDRYRCEEIVWGGKTYRRAYVGCTYHCS